MGIREVALQNFHRSKRRAQIKKITQYRKYFEK
jgi:hypothetical protein